MTYRTFKFLVAMAAGAALLAGSASVAEAATPKGALPAYLVSPLAKRKVRSPFKPLIDIGIEATSTGSPLVAASAGKGLSPFPDKAKVKVTGLSADLKDGTLLETPLRDRTSGDSDYLSFTLPQAATIYVAYDRRAKVLPSWLQDGGFTLTKEKVTLSDGAGTRRVYAKTYAAGDEVTLGGNVDTVSKKLLSQYVVIAVPN